MKIRVYSPIFPFPVTEGSHHVIYDQLRALHFAGHKLELLTWKDSAEELRTKCSKLPTDSFLRKIRLTHLPTRQLRGTWERITRIARSFFTGLASPELYYYPTDLHPPTSGTVDLAIYHFSFAYSLFNRAHGEARQIAYFHNLESELAETRIADSPPVARQLHARNARILARHERTLATLADETWFVSPEDRDHFRARAPEIDPARLRLVPPGFDPTIRHPSAAPREAGIVLGFLGRMDFKPNFDSAAWIIRSLAPELQRRQFMGKIWIVGSGMPPVLAEEAKAFHFIEVFGFLPSTETFWNELDVLLCPHLSGSGVRIKLLEALARGVPAFTTAGGAHRLHPDLQSHPDLFVAETAVEWAMRLKEVRKKTPRPPVLPPALDGRQICSFIGQALPAR